MKFWKTIIALAAACLAGGLWETTAQETPEPETLEVHYTDSGGTFHTLQVEKDVEVLRFDSRTTSLTLPEGLTKLHTLEIGTVLGGGFRLASLKLPKDLGKEAEWTFRLMFGGETIPLLAVHKDMGRFLLLYNVGRRGAGVVPTRIPSAEKLIKNRIPDDDGVFRIDQSDHHYLGVEVIEVYEFTPKPKITIRGNGIEIRWPEGILQSSPTINGPWKDAQPVRVHTLRVRRSFRSPLPVEFFRVKP